jgi:uncharacterized membrane protein YecN with MAPEG domain
MSFTPPAVSALTAGVLVILQTVLMLTVVLARRRARQEIGDAGNPELLAAVRRHGNFAENAALFVAGFTLLEVLGGNRALLMTMCIAFVGGRISHIAGLSMKKTLNVFRIAGTATTASVGFVLGLQLIRLGRSSLGM